MTITEQRIDQGIVVSIAGRFDSVTSSSIQKRLSDLLRENKLVVVDLKDLANLSSDGMRVLILMSKLAKEYGSQMSFIQVPTHVVEILKITGLLNHLKIFTDLQSALNG